MRVAFQYSAFLLMSLLILVVACQDASLTTPSGFKYTLLSTDQSGVKPVEGQYLILELSLKNQKDSLLYGGAENPYLPIKYDTYLLKLTKPNPIKEAIFAVEKGDRVMMEVQPSDVVFFAPELAATLGDQSLNCEAGLIDILDYEKYVSWKEQQLAATRQRYAHQIDKDIRAEVATIDSLLLSSEQTFTTSESGIRYIVRQPGEGPYPRPGDMVYFDFEITYLDGEVLPGILGRSGAEPESFILGTDQALQSWQESISQLRVGATGTFYIPSTLAFGKQNSYGVRPNATLVATISLIKIEQTRADEHS